MNGAKLYLANHSHADRWRIPIAFHIHVRLQLSYKHDKIKESGLCKAMATKTITRFASVVLVLLCIPYLINVARAQTATGQRVEGSPRYQYATRKMSDSEEQRLANQVTLSAEKIIEILRDEPGLTVEVKKALVKKAYEQGKLLDPESLTDSVLYGLINEDNNVRIIATNQILDRLYVQAKPTKEELEHGRYPLETPGKEEAPAGNQERRYWDNWEKQRQKAEAERKAAPYQGPAPNQAPTVPPQEVSPQLQVNRASVDRNVPDMVSGPDAQQLSQITPDQLPDVLRGSGVTPASMTQMGSTGSSTGNPSIPNLGSGSYSMSGGIQSQSSGQEEYVQRASLENGMRRRIPGLASANVDDNTVIRREPNPYANVPSLYDLYSQVSARQPRLERFGANIFEEDNRNFDDLPMDLPVGPDYVVGPGDGLNIDLWGSVSQRLIRTVDREGRVALPEVGTVMVAGKSLGDVQTQVQAILRTQFRDVHADVSLSRLRTVRVYVVGDVLHPGAYDISSLSTPLNALYAAGGPTQRGSLRIVKHFRGNQLIQEIDLYDLILHGTRGAIQTLQPGDTVLVPPIGPQVKVEGMVRRPAIYELYGEKNLAELLALAGGVLPTGTLRHIEVERIQAHENRTMLSLDIPEANDAQKVTQALDDFKIQGGDSVRISPILPYSEKTVYLDGHVFHPGKYPYQKGMKISDLIKSYGDLLPEPYESHAEVIRLSRPDFRPTVLSFNLADAMSGGVQDLELQPFDTVRIFGRFDFEDPPIISVIGEVREPGPHRTNGVTTLSDAIYLAGGLTPAAMLSDVQVIRDIQGGKVKVLSANLGRALAGDATDNITLQPRDRVIVHRNLAKMDPPSVTIEGEVARPGRYPLGSDMTAAQLVRIAGGLKRSAYRESADLSRYVIENGSKLLGEHEEVPIGRALAGEPDTDVRLRDGDVLTIRMIGGWTDIGGSISVKGEVVYPGAYGIKEGERLSSILKRAGGFRPQAYPYGAVFERVQVRELAEKNRQDLIRRIEVGSDIRVSPDVTGQEQAALVRTAMSQQQQVLTALKSQPVSGRMVIHISADISKWEGTVDDIVVRPGDTLYIPKQPYFVMVIGQVFNSNAISYEPGKDVSWYLKQAGGPTDLANTKNIFVVRADGSLLGKDSGGFWGGGVMSAKLRPGDSIVVPEKFVTGSSAFKTVLQTANVLSQIAFTAVVALR
jgi:protein involved in polysaccharide export with SLBB domain